MEMTRPTMRRGDLSLLDHPVARAQLEQMSRLSPTIARIALRPTWADVIDFETRPPAGMERR